MADGLAVERAQPGDHAAILALHRQAGWPGTHVSGEVWAVREGGAIVGSVQLLELAPGLVLIDAAVVREDARGRGIGAHVLRTVLASRTAEWWLECREERIAFYQRLDFAVVPASSVPTSVMRRVGGNPARRQFFLNRRDNPPPGV